MRVVRSMAEENDQQHREPAEHFYERIFACDIPGGDDLVGEIVHCLEGKAECQKSESQNLKPKRPSCVCKRNDLHPNYLSTRKFFDCLGTRKNIQQVRQFFLVDS